MDGTLFDVPYDWTRIRTELETKGEPILVHLQKLEEPERSEKWKMLEDFEHEATQKARLKVGVPEILNFLLGNGIKRALVTNNTDKNVKFLLKKFRLEFDFIISRDSGYWKPSGRPFIAVMKEFGWKRDECCVVGDSRFDVQAAAEAEIVHVFVLSQDNEEFLSAGVHICQSIPDVHKEIERLSQGGTEA